MGRGWISALPAHTRGHLVPRGDLDGAALSPEHAAVVETEDCPGLACACACEAGAMVVPTSRRWRIRSGGTVAVSSVGGVAGTLGVGVPRAPWTCEGAWLKARLV